MKKKKRRAKGKLSSQIAVLFVLGGFLAFLDIWIYFFDYRAGIIITVFLLVYLACTFVIYVYNKPYYMNDMISFATEYGQIQKRLLKELQLPHALLDDSGHIMWTNNEFDNVTGLQKGMGKNIHSLFREITADKLPIETPEAQMEVSFDNRVFQAKMKRIDVSGMMKNNEFVNMSEEQDFLIGIYLFEETALRIALQEIDDQSIAVGMIYLDNIEEALDDEAEVRRSLLLALVERKINKYVSMHDGIIRKMEKDKFFVIFRKKTISQIKEAKFDILEDIKNINLMADQRPLTLSIGFGLDGLTYSQNCEFARAAIDLALGRGGDQAVVKSPGSIQYFGGKSQQVEKNTRVKARVKAQALEEIISTKDQVFVMGHRLADVDSFGAAVGIYTICKQLQKKVHIVMNDITPSLKPVVNMFTNGADCPQDLIINSAQALERVNDNTVLVVVDINRPSITDCPDLLKLCKAIVVLDHHRQGTESIENATLSYVEPYASSACEMVAEILQYVDNGVKLNGIEADALYSGIVIDTNNFNTKTGVRTFEAAAYLRRSGADVTRVRKLFREDASEYMAKAKTIRDTVIYRNDYAISVCEGVDCQSPTIVAAQAANELLNINGVKASFVFTEYQNKIFLSARSIDELNVQVVTEKMGGGGHMNVAGAQFTDKTMEEAKQYLQSVLDEMIDSGEI